MYPKFDIEVSEYVEVSESDQINLSISKHHY